MDQVVCYPYIEPDSSWLKIAALCWERVYRVTSRHAPPDSLDITELNAALNEFLLPVYPDDIVDENIVERLRSWLTVRREQQTGESIGTGDNLVGKTEGFLLFQDKAPQSVFRLLWEFSALQEQTEEVIAPRWKHHELRGRTGEWVKRDPMELKPPFWEGAAEYARWVKYRRKAVEWEEEGDDEAASFFERKADALWERSLKPVEVNTGLYLVDMDVAMYYLSLIASEKARQLKADLFAESSEAAKQAATFSGIAGTAATAILEAHLPEDLDTLAPAQIADFREATVKDRFKFQKALQSVVNEIQSVSSEVDIERLKRIAVELATERIEETKKAYRYARIQTGIKALGTSLTPPALLSWIASTLHVGLFMPAAVASTIALFGVQMLIDRDKAQTEAEKSGWAYVLKMQKKYN
jgi:hypothetical protein